MVMPSSVVSSTVSRVAWVAGGKSSNGESELIAARYPSKRGVQKRQTADQNAERQASCSHWQDEGERKSSGGILIPATAQMAKRLVWAEVIALGQNVRSAEVGDRVLFSPEDRYEVEVQGEDLVMLRERDIHAVAAERIEASTGLYL